MVVSEMTTLVPSAAGGSWRQRLSNGASASSKPGETQSAGLRHSGSLALCWSATGNWNVIPTGWGVRPASRSWRLTTSMTQYCQAVESPLGVSIVIPSGMVTTSADTPEDSLATSYSTLGRSCTVSTTWRI